MQRGLLKQSRTRDRRLATSRNSAQRNKTSNSLHASKWIPHFDTHSKSSVRHMVAVNHSATKLNFRGKTNFYDSTLFYLRLCHDADASHAYVFRERAFRQAGPVGETGGYS